MDKNMVYVFFFAYSVTMVDLVSSFLLISLQFCPRFLQSSSTLLGELKSIQMIIL